MKKFLSTLMVGISVIACAFSFTACGDNSGDENKTHTTHNWSTTYTQDGDRHYQTCDGCEEKNYAPHDFTNGDCVCGKEKPHSHTWSITYTEDGDRHYQTCGGCEEKNYAPHDYGTSGVCVCGKQKPETPPETVNVTSVTLNEKSLTLDIGDEATLTASILPENATNKAVSWTVAPAGVVTVENGKVTAIKDGTATITATADGKDDTCTVTVTAPLTNAQVLKYLNDNVLPKVGQKFAEKHFLELNENNITNVTWFITKNGNNIVGANVVFTYFRTNKAHNINLYTIEFSALISPQNIINNEIGAPIIAEIYSPSINPTIQTEHKALTNAICDKVFGTTESTINDRYIIENARTATDPKLGDAITFTVIQVTDIDIKERVFVIAEANTDTELIENVNNENKSYIDSEITSHSITGAKLLNNSEKF